MTAANQQTRRRFDAPLAELIAEAAALRDSAHGRLISYSRKVFIPLTKLCRDVCHYCTFAQVPRAGKPVYLAPDKVLAIARAGVACGCETYDCKRDQTRFNAPAIPSGAAIMKATRRTP